MGDNERRADSRDRMIAINAAQKNYYESVFAARSSVGQIAANATTNSWTRMRRSMMSMGNRTGVHDHIFSLHKEWLGDLSEAKVLDFGCFKGNELSLWLASEAGSYLGIDLSEGAIEELNAKLSEHGLPPEKARAEQCDVLDNSFEDETYDVIYAQGVLHHFMDMDEILLELKRILKPGGCIITIDPMMTEPTNRLIRFFYRPFQTNKQWEWPFTRKTFVQIGKHFRIDQLQGHFGMTKLGYPLMLVPGLRGIGRKISERGLKFDNDHSREFGLPFYLCWKVTMRLGKPLGE